jgi:hypothetical protein
LDRVFKLKELSHETERKWNICCIPPKNLSVIGKFEIYAVSQFEDLQSVNLFKMLATFPLSF